MFITTKYGKIPKVQLTDSIIPKTPKEKLPNYLPNLYLGRIDTKNTCLDYHTAGKFFPINKQFSQKLNCLPSIHSKFEFVKAKGSKPVELPKHMTPKLAYFIGYFIGDGGLKDAMKTYSKTKRFEHKLIIGDEFLIQITRIKQLFWDLFKMVCKGDF